MLVSLLVQPRFDFSCMFWYRSCGLTYQKKLQICQNKCIRFIEQLPMRTHINQQHFTGLKWLNVKTRVDHLTLCKMYNVISGNSPSYMNNLLSYKSHSYSTRQGENSMQVPSVKSHGKNSFGYNGTVLWNSLPIDKRSKPTMSAFKTSCKYYLLESMKSSANEIFLLY